MSEREENVILQTGDTIFLYQGEEVEPIEYLVNNICVKLTQDGHWTTVFVVCDVKKGGKEEIPEWMFMGLLKNYDLYRPEHAETAKKYRKIKGLITYFV